jgi:hypothetical protein
MVKRKYISVTEIKPSPPQFAVGTNKIQVTTDLMYIFYAKLGEGATDTYEKIQKAFDNDSPSRAQVFRW